MAQKEAPVFREGTLVEVIKPITGSAYPATKGGYQSSFTIQPGRRAMVILRTGGLKSIANPQEGWRAALDTTTVRRIGTVRGISHQTFILHLDDEGTNAHEYRFDLPRTPKGAATARMAAWLAYLSGDMGNVIFLGAAQPGDPELD